MRLRIALLALLVAAPAFAEDAAPAATPTETPAPAVTPAAPAQPQKFYLELDPSDLAAISSALNELPKKIADPLILRLNGQLQNQAMISGPAAKALEPKKKK